jgi:hypothetical protein
VSRWSTFWVTWHADRPQADWQVLYNAACYFALIGDADNAFKFLTRALDEGGAGQLYGLADDDRGEGRALLRESWINRDPDLAYLRRDERRWNALRDRTDLRYPYSSTARRNAIVQGLLGAVAAVALVAIVLLAPWMWLGIAIVVLAAGWFVMVIARYHWNEKKLTRLVPRSSVDGRIRDPSREDRHADA